MGWLWDKIKSVGSKVVKGVVKGFHWVKDKVVPVVKKILPVVGKVAPVIGGAVGRPDIGAAVGGAASKASEVMGKLGL